MSKQNPIVVEEHCIELHRCHWRVGMSQCPQAAIALFQLLPDHTKEWRLALCITHAQEAFQVALVGNYEFCVLKFLVTRRQDLPAAE